MDDLDVEAAQAERMARRRRQGLIRPYVENLLSDIRLREALTDEQAQTLLAWGVAQIEAQGATVPDPTAATAEAYMEAQAFNVGRILRAVNRLLLLPTTEVAERAAEWESMQAALVALGLGSEGRLARLAALHAAGAPDFEQLFGMLGQNSAESPPPLPQSPRPLLAAQTATALDSFALEPAPTLSAMPTDLPDPSAEMPAFPTLTSVASPVDPDL